MYFSVPLVPFDRLSKDYVRFTNALGLIVDCRIHEDCSRKCGLRDHMLT